MRDGDEQLGLWDEQIRRLKVPSEKLLELYPQTPEMVQGGVRLLRFNLRRLAGDRADLVPDRMLESITRLHVSLWRAGLIDLLRFIAPERVTADGMFADETLADGMDGESIRRAIEGRG